VANRRALTPRWASDEVGTDDVSDDGDPVAWFAERLKHVEGEWAGRPFSLAGWQAGIVRDLFGTLNADGLRQYRTALIGVPRKNGKSTLAAGIALRLLFSSEPAAQVFCIASDKDQARLVFNIASRMVEANPDLLDACGGQLYRNAIPYPRMDSTLKVISAESFTKHGLNPHGVVFDELHAQPDRELWDVLTTAQGARREPLTVAITTAGYDRASICFEQYDYGRRVEAGIVTDPTFFFEWFGADDEADWTDPAVWAAVNPNYPTTPKPEFLQAEFEKAKQLPARQNTFRRLYLNQWTQSSTRWLDLGLWDDNAGTVDEAGLGGRYCHAGLDVKSTSDFTAVVYAFPGGDNVEILARFFIPQGGVDRRSSLRPTLDEWVRDGFLTVTPGDVVDDEAIVQQILEDHERFRIRTLAFNPWDARGVVARLEADGIECIKIPQSMVRLSGPSKELERLLGDRKLAHSGNPIMRWMADNVVAKEDGTGGVMPDHAASTEKIPGISALVMALSEVMLPPQSSALDWLQALAKMCPACDYPNVATHPVCAKCGAPLPNE
jgi:phage terminase large subunit-like protein